MMEDIRELDDELCVYLGNYVFQLAQEYFHHQDNLEEFTTTVVPRLKDELTQNINELGGDGNKIVESDWVQKYHDATIKTVEYILKTYPESSVSKFEEYMAEVRKYVLERCYTVRTTNSEEKL